MSINTANETEFDREHWLNQGLIFFFYQRILIYCAMKPVENSQSMWVEI